MFIRKRNKMLHEPEDSKETLLKDIADCFDALPPLERAKALLLVMAIDHSPEHGTGDPELFGGEMLHRLDDVESRNIL